MKTIFKIYIMVVRHCAWQILSSLGAELLVAMLGPIGLQVYEKQVQALEAGALEQLVLFLIIMLTVNIVAIIIENLDGLLTQKMQLEITRNFGKPVFEYIQNVPLYHMSDSNFVADKERAINAVENDILLVVQNINGSIALIVSIIVLSVMVAQYDVLALVVLIIMVIVQNVFTKRGTSEGVELLIHIGLDTVALKGEHFTAYKGNGDSVKKGELLIEADLDAVKKAGYDVITPVVVCNTSDYLTVETVTDQEVEPGDTVLILNK